MSPHLTDDEIASITEPLKQGAARIRFFQRAGIRAIAKPSGQPLVVRADWDNLRQATTGELTLELVCAMAQPFRSVAGVYFLVKEMKVIYVGQSANIYSRIEDHRSAKVAFDRWHFVRVDDKSERLRIESLYIESFRPPLNRGRQ